MNIEWSPTCVTPTYVCRTSRQNNRLMMVEIASKFPLYITKRRNQSSISKQATAGIFKTAASTACVNKLLETLYRSVGVSCGIFNGRLITGTLLSLIVMRSFNARQVALASIAIAASVESELFQVLKHFCSSYRTSKPSIHLNESKS